MKNINKIGGKIIAAALLAAVVLTVGVVMFAGSKKAQAELAWPKVGEVQDTVLCSNGLGIVRTASCDGTTKVVVDTQVASCEPSVDFCSNISRRCNYKANMTVREKAEYDNCVIVANDSCSKQVCRQSSVLRTVGTVENSPECPATCTVANDCGATASGHIINGVCDAVKPAMPDPIRCSTSANNCNKRNYGYKYCGSNSACSDNKYIALSAPADNAQKDTACTSAPNCQGTTSQGTYNCFGKCSATTPDPVSVTCTSAQNACGQTATGTKVCPNDACSATTPAMPSPTVCYSEQNTCGMYATSTIACPNDTCPASKPSDNLCNSCFPNAKPATYGLACRSDANCRGKTTGGGTIGCDGKCNVTPPDPIPTSCTSAANDCGQTATGTRACPNDACSATTPTNPAHYGESCTSAPNCQGATSPGTIGCDGKCNATTPTATAQSCESAPNNCGMTNTGTKTCPSDTCSAQTPSDDLCTCPNGEPANYDESCYSAPNCRGDTAQGKIGCDGKCSATPPTPKSDIACTSTANDCGQTAAGTKACPNDSCSATTPANPDPITCTTSENTCGMTQTGTKACPFSSCLPQVSDSECPSITCESDPNHCGQTSTGTIVNGVCNATTPSDPQIYIDTGSCTPPPKIDGQCSTTAVDGCLGGSIYSDRADSNTENLWTCKGLNDGKNALCSLPKPNCLSTDVVSVIIDPPTSSISPGKTTSWTWKAKNATWCDIYINNVLHSSGSNMSGTYNSPALFASTTYSIQCINDKCGIPYPTASSTHIVSVGGIPSPEVTVIPPTNTITSGGQTTFTWTAINTTTCRLFENGNYLRVVDPSGAYSSGPLTAPTEYAVSCVNEIGPGPTYPTAVDHHNVTITSPASDPPFLGVVEKPIQYNNIAFGETHTQRLTVKNVGGGTLIGNIAIVNNENDAFSIEESNKSFSLASLDTKTFNVTFAPRKSSQGKLSFVRKLAASMGLIAAKTISITSNAVAAIKSNGYDNGPMGPGNQNVPLMGNGVENISGENLDVGDVPVGVTRVFPYPIRNNTLDPISICLRIPTNSTFKCGTEFNCSKTVVGGREGIFNIAFAPTSIKRFKDIVTVGILEANGVCKKVYDLEITGNGVKPIATFIEK